MKTTQQWLEEKVSVYNENPKEALEEMLSTTTDVIQQFVNNPNSLAAKGVLDTCLKHNKLFLQKVGIITVGNMKRLPNKTFQI